MERLHLIVNEGKIVDASFIEVPRQRNSRDENEQIKAGQTPEAFKTNAARRRQKDVDARWTKKNNQTIYGYKVRESRVEDKGAESGSQFSEDVYE